MTCKDQISLALPIVEAGRSIRTVEAKCSIALVQPVVELGKSIRIEKSPTGIQYLSAYMREQGHTVRMYHQKVSDALIRAIADFDPFVLGISTVTTGFPAAKKLATLMKLSKPDITIVLGGWHASGCAISWRRGYETWSLSEILHPDSVFDYVVVGEGEHTFSELIGILRSAPAEEQECLIRALPGTGFCVEGGEIHVSSPQREVDLNSLPFPDWDGLDVDMYRDKRDPRVMDLSVHSQRGCRFHCTFCQTPDAYPGKVQRQSPVRTAEYIEQLIDRFHPTTITFTDEDFMSNVSWIRELCCEIIRRECDQKAHFDSFGSVWDLQRLDKAGLLTLMKRTGFDSFFAGIESLDVTTLKTYQRPFQPSGGGIEAYVSAIQNAVDLARGAGLTFMADYMVGFFDEPEDSVRRGFERLCQLRGIPYIYMPVLTPFPGTPLWKLAIEKNSLLRVDGAIPWELYDCSHQVTKLSYDLTSLRDELEQKYYVCDTYGQTVLEDIARFPERLDDLYRPVFSVLCADYPCNAFLRERLSWLSTLDGGKGEPAVDRKATGSA